MKIMSVLLLAIPFLASLIIGGVYVKIAAKAAEEKQEGAMGKEDANTQ